MGSKGQSSQISTYTANPAVGNAGNTAISMATNAAMQPFQAPVAPVAPFVGDQLQAQQQYRNLQGTAQPYYNQAANYASQSAAPITGQDVGNYLNPYAAFTLGNLAETQGQQMQDLNGRLRSQAGGVGASRIAVGQSELARQQNLATGATLANIYQPALAAAQQQKQMAANAGYAYGNLGTSAQNAAIQGSNVLNTSGNQQQAQNQAQLNAPYQNELARIAYPYQNAQYLANITGSLSGALGGTTNTVNTPAQPNIFSQVAGLGLAGAGLYGQFGGGFGGFGGGVGDYGQAFNATGLGAGTGGMSFPVFAKDGGRIGEANNKYAAGGMADWMAVGSPADLNPADYVKSAAPPKPAPAQKEDSGGGFGDILKTAAQVIPFFLKNGGAAKANGGTVGPYSGFQNYADGGYTSFDDRFSGLGPFQEVGAGPVNIEPFQSATGSITPHNNAMQMPPAMPPAPQGSDIPYGPGSDSDPIRMPDQESVEAWRRGTPLPSPEGPPQAAPTETAAAPSPYKPPVVAADDDFNPSKYEGKHVNPEDYVGLKNGLPYGDLNLANDPSRKLAKSPWMALFNAGATMLGGSSPFFGVNVGKGLEAGSKTLEDQRKALQTEEGINQRARQLMQAAQFHADTYNKMTPYQKASLEQSQQKIDSQYIQGPIDLTTGQPMWIMRKSDGKFITLGNNNTGAAASVTPVGQTVNQPTSASGPQTPPEAAPFHVPDLASNTQPTKLPQPPIPKGSPQAAIVSRENNLISSELQKKAASLPELENNMLAMKSAFAKVMQDQGKDNVLTKLATMPGVPPNMTFGDRIERAKAINFAAILAGKQPPINPEKLAAVEEMSKIQQRMGSAFAAQLSSRPAFAMEKIGINATPGPTNTPKGFLSIIPAFDAALQNTRDQIDSWAKWQQVNPYAPQGWRSDFMKKNTPDMYYTRSVIENLPDKTVKEKLPQAVELLRKNPSQENITAFNKRYGGTASYFLTGKIAPYEGAQ